MRVRAPEPAAGGRAAARVLGVAAAAAILATLTACGGGDGEDERAVGAPEDAAAAAHAALEEARTFAFAARYVRTRADAPDDPEEYASSEGVVDVVEDRGRLVLRLTIEGLEDADEPGEPIELHWDAETLAAHGRDEVRSLPRAEARENGGLIGRWPDEPGGLVTLLRVAREPEPIGRETIGGHETTGYRFTVDRRAAGQAGVPVELSRALEAGQAGVRLGLEAWLDDDALPHRLAYVVDLDPVHDEETGREVLPARTISATYELSEFGAPVDVSIPPPEE